MSRGATTKGSVPRGIEWLSPGAFCKPDPNRSRDRIATRPERRQDKAAIHFSSALGNIAMVPIPTPRRRFPVNREHRQATVDTVRTYRRAAPRRQRRFLPQPFPGCSEGSGQHVGVARSSLCQRRLRSSVNAEIRVRSPGRGAAGGGGQYRCHDPIPLIFVSGLPPVVQCAKSRRRSMSASPAW